MDVTQATEIKNAAAAAWIAAGRPKTGGEREALDNALRALAAAKRESEAAAKVGQPSVDQQLAAFAAAGGKVQSAAARRLDEEAPLRRAAKALAAAMAWPRCGQDWPASAAEQRADTLLREKFGSIEAASAAMEAFS